MIVASTDGFSYGNSFLPLRTRWESVATNTCLFVLKTSPWDCPCAFPQRTNKLSKVMRTGMKEYGCAITDGISYWNSFLPLRTRWESVATNTCLFVLKTSPWDCPCAFPQRTNKLSKVMRTGMKEYGCAITDGISYWNSFLPFRTRWESVATNTCLFILKTSPRDCPCAFPQRK